MLGHWILGAILALPAIWESLQNGFVAPLLHTINQDGFLVRLNGRDLFLLLPWWVSNSIAAARVLTLTAVDILGLGQLGSFPSRSVAAR